MLRSHWLTIHNMLRSYWLEIHDMLRSYWLAIHDMLRSYWLTIHDMLRSYWLALHPCECRLSAGTDDDRFHHLLPLFAVRLEVIAVVLCSGRRTRWWSDY